MIVVHMLSVSMDNVFASMDTSENTMNVSKQVSLAGVTEGVEVQKCLESVKVFQAMYTFGNLRMKTPKP